MKGIVLIAGGNVYYGKCAYNLALSIKALSDLPITLYYHAEAINHLTGEHREVFDNIIRLEDKYCESGANYCLSKLWLDKLSPYKETLYLDVDTILTPYADVYSLFKDFDISNRGYTTNGNGYAGWVNVYEFCKVHGIDKYLDCGSEVITFTKTDVFKESRKAYKNKEGVRRFSGALPDEPFLAVGIEKSGIELEVWKPNYWQLEAKKMPSRASLYNSYPVFSIGGNVIPNASKLVYKGLSNYYSKQLMKPKAFDIADKRRVLKQRYAV